jgi:hypothetical protein
MTITTYSAHDLTGVRGGAFVSVGRYFWRLMAMKRAQKKNFKKTSLGG